MKGYSGLDMKLGEVGKFVEHARQEAIATKNFQIGTGHILLAILALGSNRLAVKNMPPQLEQIVREYLGTGDNSEGKRPELSEAAKDMLRSGEVVYGDPEYEQTSRCEIAKLISSLVRNARSYEQDKDLDYFKSEHPLLDCARKALFKSQPNFRLLDNIAEYEHNHDLNDALRLDWDNKLLLLLQVFETPRYADLDAPAQEVESLIKRYSNEVAQNINNFEQHEKNAKQAKLDAANYEAMLKGLRKQLKELNDSIEYLQSVGEPGGPLDAGTQALTSQRDKVQAHIDDLTKRVEGANEIVKLENSRFNQRYDDAGKAQMNLNALNKVLKTYRDYTTAALQKAQAEARQVLLADLLELAKSEPKT